jgi:protein gp37
VEFFIDEKILAEPLKRKKPARIFVGDMFDLFHEAIPQELIAEVLRVAWKLPRHTFQILTKRAERMQRMVAGMYGKWGDPGEQPRDNIWLGVSVESQKYADERIPLLLQTPAAVRFLSVEPQLEAVNLVSIDGGGGYFFNCLTDRVPFGHYEYKTGIDWVICGGESGPGARPMHPGWPRSLRDQCAAANIPFFFKQWGEWQPHQYPPDPNADYHGGLFLLPNGQLGNQGDWWSGRAHAMDRVGKKNAGALLDGREWREFPQPSQKEAVSA